MDIRYQVFVSSTFTDLQEERRGVIQTLMEIDCIPAGMEWFPAQDQDQLEFIKRVIDDCDYYLLVIGGRYGSISASGISFTEQEYDYAVSKGLKVIVLIHEAPGALPLDRSEGDPVAREKLAAFREKVSAGRLVKLYRDAADLRAKVATSMIGTIKAFPAVGWTRASRVAGADLLQEINVLRKQKEQLEAALAAALPKGGVPPDLAEFDERFELTLTYRQAGTRYANAGPRTARVASTWSAMFAAIAPTLVEATNESTVGSTLAQALLGRSESQLTIDQSDLHTIRIQFQALGLIEVEQLITQIKTLALFWKLTPLGERRSFELRAVRTAKPKPETPLQNAETA